MVRPEANKEYKLQEAEDARILYVDICRGYSEIPCGDDSFFWRHPDEYTFAELSMARRRYEYEAVDLGVKKEKIKIKELIKVEAWTEKEEKEFEAAREAVEWSQSQLSKLVLKGQQELCLQELEKEKEHLRDVSELRQELLGMTAEIYAAGQINKDYVSLYLFKDKELEKPLYKGDMSELPETMLTPWIDLTNYERLWYSDDNYKKIAVWPFFMNSFFLCDDDATNFFRKPVPDHTHFQTDLLSAGRFVKGVLAHGDKSPPTVLYEDLEALINWYNMQHARIKSGRKQGASKDGSKERNRVG